MFSLLFKKQYKTILLYVLFFCTIFFAMNHGTTQHDERYEEDYQRYLKEFDLKDTKTFFKTLEADAKEAGQIVLDIQYFNSYDDFDKEQYANLLDPFLLLTGNASYATYDMLVWQKNMLSLPGKYTKSVLDDELMLGRFNREFNAQKNLTENIENLKNLSQRGLRRNDYKYALYQKTLNYLEDIDTNLPVTRTYYVEKVLDYITSDYSIYALILFSIFATFSGLAQNKISHTILISKMGMRHFVKLQILVNILTSLLGFFVYYLLQFILLGGFHHIEAWNIPIQAVNGYEYVMISFSTLEYLLFLLLTKAVFAVVVAMLSSLLSLICKNNLLSALLHAMLCGIWYFMYSSNQLEQFWQTTNMINSAPCTLFSGGGNILVTYFPYFMLGNYPFFYGYAYILLLIVIAGLLFAIAILGSNKFTARIRTTWKFKPLGFANFTRRQVR